MRGVFKFPQSGERLWKNNLRMEEKPVGFVRTIAGSVGRYLARRRRYGRCGAGIDTCTGAGKDERTPAGRFVTVCRGFVSIFEVLITLFPF
jgi:hypothetical protein